MITIKIGGSLIHSAKKIVKDLTEYSNLIDNSILIVPGGSIFADTVRKVDPSQEAAHWMAMLAMEQYGYYLADGTEAKLIESLNIKENGTYVLLPYDLLKKKDELPHSWDVTSDTIAAWVAKQLGARFIKVTDVDGIYIDGLLKKELNASDIIGIETCVDAELPRFLIKNRMDCEIVNGNCPGRLIKAFHGDVIGTIIRG
ncbi:MAG: amino acid kinase [Candidatus Methanoperedens sp.]|nr:amino acid kinase [Candidatus Methanoperedens sp.]MCE8424589.1 amino acid kinase [Candidatus Methanoperedens sp.]